MAQIIFFALGGLDERGKNLYCLDINKEIYIFDAGVKKPEKGILGIDTVMPNFDFLKNNFQRIKGIFISKSSDECSEAVKYIIKELMIPIYGSNLTCNILKFHLQRLKIKIKENIFHPIKEKDIINFGDCQIEVFSTTTCMLNSFGYAIYTPDGTIIYSGDYIFDAKANKSFTTNMQHLNQIFSKNKVLLLLTEASTASRNGYTAPKHEIKKYVERVIKENQGRIIFACFDQDLHKINEIFNLIREININVGIYGQTLIESLKIIEKEAQINMNGINIKPLYNVVKLKKSVIIITGNREKLYTRLIKIANGYDNIINIKNNDTIILATPPNPGSELNHANVLDELTRTNAKVIPLSSKHIWTMTASYEDIKLMISLVKPKYLIPIKGLYKDFIKVKEAGIETGMLLNNIIICDNGEFIEIKNGEFIKIIKKIKTSDLYVDNIGISDIGSIVLNERKQLATDGVVIIGVSVENKTKEILSLIDTQMRGVIYIQENNDIFKKMQKQIIIIIEKHQAKFKAGQSFDNNQIKHEIKNTLGTFVKQETGKTPIILAIVNEI